jgi:signal transduction histidine kinase
MAAQRSPRRPSSLPDQILRAEERVRRELARDLHDGPLQALAAMEMRLQFIKRLSQLQPERVQYEVDELSDLVRATGEQIRGLLFELRPLVLETQGLVPALRFFLKQFPDRDLPRVHLQTGGFEVRLAPHAERALFSIVREALINAVKHAQAENAWVTFQLVGDLLRVEVRDDGVGFAPEAAQQGYERQRSLGIVNMSERAERIGAQLRVESAPGQGTRVLVSLPLPAPAEG